MDKLKAWVVRASTVWGIYQLLAAIGLTALLGTLALAFVAELQSLRFHWQMLFVGGVALLSVVVVWVVWPLVLRLRGQLQGEQSDLPPSERVRFSPYSIQARIARVDLTGLWRSDPYIEFTVNMRSIWPVEITSLGGNIRCAGEDCNTVPTLRDAPLQLESPSNNRPAVLRQPVTNLMAEGIMPPLGQLFSEDSAVRFDLSAVQLYGTVDLPHSRDLLGADCYLQLEPFVVRGPVRDEDAAGKVQRTETIFVNSELYDGLGRPREASEGELAEGSGAASDDDPARTVEARDESEQPAVRLEALSDGTTADLRVRNDGPTESFEAQMEVLRGTPSTEQIYHAPWREADGMSGLMEIVANGAATLKICMVPRPTEGFLNAALRQAPVRFFAVEGDFDRSLTVLLEPATIDLRVTLFTASGVAVCDGDFRATVTERAGFKPPGETAIYWSLHFGPLGGE